MKELFYLNKYFVKYKTRFIVGILFVILTNVFKVLSPQVLGYAIDLVSENLTLTRAFSGFELKEILTNSIYKNILIFSLVYFGIALLAGLFTFLMRQSIIVMSRLIENDLRNEIYEHYQKLDQAFYKRNNTGDLMNKATEDVSKVRMYLGPAVMYSINVLMLFSFVIYSMLSIDVMFTFWVLLPMPILIFCIYKVQSLINLRSRKIQERLSDLTTHAQEFYSGIRVLKSFVQEKLAINFYKEQSQNYMTESLKMARIEAFFFPLMILLIGLSTVLVVYIGGIKMNEGSITPGNVLEFVFYVNMLTWPISSVGWVATIIQTAAASQKRINDFLKSEPIIKNTSNEKADFNGDLVFDNVSFTYPDTGIEAIKNLSFSIPKGEKWAIMGKTGSGKSSIAELIERLYDVSEGSISISGKNIKNVALENYRENIGYVPQDVFLFSNTIANNIKFSDLNFTIEDVITAAKKASIHDEIMKFPKQYDTLVGERGITLSGGQKQRIAMARVLIKSPELFILDDSLSALDTKTEKTILGNLNTSFENKTVLIITHRIPSYIKFDKILVLENGSLSEFGTHKELIQQKKHYFSVYQKQKER
ncbi:MAG: ABC transporter ATP-binding protein [Chitinophagales bacterium]